MDEPVTVVPATTKVGISVRDSLMVSDSAERRRVLDLVSDAGIDYVGVGDHLRGT